MFKVNNKNTRTYFTLCSSVSIVNFEWVNTDWDFTCTLACPQYGSIYLINKYRNIIRCNLISILYNLQNVKNTHRKVLLFVTLLKVTPLHGCFSRVLNCANDTKLRKASYIKSFYFPIMKKVDAYVLQYFEVLLNYEDL